MREKKDVDINGLTLMRKAPEIRSKLNISSSAIINQIFVWSDKIFCQKLDERRKVGVRNTQSIEEFQRKKDREHGMKGYEKNNNRLWEFELYIGVMGIIKLM